MAILGAPLYNEELALVDDIGLDRNSKPVYLIIRLIMPRRFLIPEPGLSKTEPVNGNPAICKTHRHTNTIKNYA
jgi:hypothetical protein